MLSPIYATVTVNDIEDTIVGHLREATKSEESKKENGTFQIGGVECDGKYLSQYSIQLWLKYFKANPEVPNFVHELRHHMVDLGAFDLQPQIGYAIMFFNGESKILLNECQELNSVIREAKQAKPPIRKGA